MKASHLIPLLMLAAGLAVGCNNSLYFYETQKVAVNLEARPDPNSPVAGSIGVKQRAAVIVPPKKIDADGRPDGDALGLLGYFNFRHNKATTIEMVLMTGEAQVAASSHAPDAFRSLAEMNQATPQSISHAAWAHAATVPGGVAELRWLVATDFDELTPEQRQRLRVLSGIGPIEIDPNDTRRLHDDLRQHPETRP